MTTEVPSDADRSATSVSDGGFDGTLNGDGASADDTGGTILIVDDDEAFAETVELWLADEWDTILAHDGDEAAEKFGPHVDVVLLDRRMPTVAGDEALKRIREQEGAARIAMMTAVDPDWDIVDMDFDMYLEKPLGRDDVFAAVDQLFTRAKYARELQALFSLSTKLGMLRASYDEEELEEDERFQELQAEFDRLHEKSQDRLGELNSDDFRELMQLIGEMG